MRLAFKVENEALHIETRLEENKTVTLTKKSKLAIASMVAVVLILAVAVHFVSAQTAQNLTVANLRTLKAQGHAYQTINDQTAKFPADLTLTLQSTSTNGAVRIFDVAGGTVVVNSVSYTITSGSGGVATGRRLILLKAQGTSLDGQAVTLKLEGRYFWMGGHIYVARISAKLQTDNGNFTLLMRAAIRV